MEKSGHKKWEDGRFASDGEAVEREIDLPFQGGADLEKKPNKEKRPVMKESDQGGWEDGSKKMMM